MSSLRARAAELLSLFPAIHDRYLVLDFETTGLDIAAEHTVPYQAGLLVVEDGNKVDQIEMRLDWQTYFRDRGTGVAFELRVAEVINQMTARGNFCDPWPVMANGEPPLDALQDLFAIVTAYSDAGYPIVGYNCWHYDRALFKKYFKTDNSPMWAAERWLDVGMLFKANLFPSLRSPLTDGSQLEAWYSQVYGYRGKGKWNQRAMLDAMQIDCSDLVLHDAVGDCVATLYLLEELKEIAAGN